MLDPKTTAARLRALADELDPPSSATPSTTTPSPDAPQIKGDRRAAYVRRAGGVVARLVEAARDGAVEGLTVDGLVAGLAGLTVDGWSFFRVRDLSALVATLDALAADMDSNDPIPADLADLAYLVADLVDVVDRQSSGDHDNPERVAVLRDSAAAMLATMGIDGPLLRHVDPRRRQVVPTVAGAVFLSYRDGFAYVDGAAGRRLASFPLVLVAAADDDDPDVQGAIAAGEPDDEDDVDDLDLVNMAIDLFGVMEQTRTGDAVSSALWYRLPVNGPDRIGWFAVAAASAAIMGRRALDVPTPAGRLFVDATEDEVVVDWRPDEVYEGIVPNMDPRADGLVVGPWFTEGADRRLVVLDDERARRGPQG